MPFDVNTTTDEVLEGLDLSGRSFVITGTSSGLGEESARALTAHGASVTMLARNSEKNEAAAARIRSSVPDARLELGQVDLSDLSSIREFAKGYLAEHPTIDVLMNNAGVMACPFQRTADGFEMQFGTNHLGHFLLTALLSPAVLAGDHPRIINVSSAGHARSDVDLDDPNFDHTEYDPWRAYGRSKTANVLFAKELARRLESRGVLAFALHPGGISTELGRHLDEATIAAMRAQPSPTTPAGDSPPPVRFKTVECGAATQVWAATGVDLVDHNGAYLGDCQLGVEGGPVRGHGFQSYVNNADTAGRLWKLSEQMVDQRFET
jgi:NAD(P)-dependent dehydrogenase (short-subunit alcohol dehydrogenase family)